MTEEFKVKKKTLKETLYKVFIEKTYRNNQGYVFMHPKEAPKDCDNKSFVLVYHFKKIPNLHNPMLVIESVSGEDFKGRLKIIKHFEGNHALEHSVKCDGLFEALNGKTKKPD